MNKQFALLHSFGANIRLASATVNNGSWIQATGSGTQGPFGTPIRTATITVGGRPVRPDGTKMIHIPQPGSLQHVAQVLTKLKYRTLGFIGKHQHKYVL